jgi:hypothetical protein
MPRLIAYAAEAVPAFTDDIALNGAHLPLAARW